MVAAWYDESVDFVADVQIEACRCFTDRLEPAWETKVESESGSGSGTKACHDPIKTVRNVEAKHAYEDLRPRLHLAAHTRPTMAQVI